MRRGFWGLMMAGGIALAGPAQAQELAPRNACRTVPGADAFRMALATAVANRDAAMLRPLVSEQVLLDFGGGSGWEEFASRLAERDLWSELDEVLALGCASDSPDELMMPSAWGEDFGIEDPFAAWMVVGEGVPLLAEDHADARVIRRMDWAAIEQLGTWQGDEEFIRVRTKDGAQGWAPVAKLRHQLDYRVLASRGADGRFAITTFVAGD